MTNKVEELKFQCQLTLCSVSIETLENMVEALQQYLTDRKLCELMCGGVEDDCDF